MITNKKTIFFTLFSLGILILIFIKIEFFNDKNEYLVEQTFEEDENYPMIVNSGSGVIFSKENLLRPRRFKGWNAVEEDVKKAEKILLECKEKGLLEILPKLSEYKRQYVGYYNEVGDKLMLINGFRDVKNRFPNWKEGHVISAGGGKNFFIAAINFDKNKCEYFILGSY